MVLFGYNLQQFIPGFIPAEHHLLFMVVVGVTALCLLIFGTPVLIRYLITSFKSLLKKFLILIGRYLLIPFKLIYQRFAWVRTTINHLQKKYYKAKGIAYFELNSLDDAVAYLRYQEDYRKLNSLPVSWLYDRIHGDLIIEAAETLRKLSVIPDLNGQYKCEISFAKARSQKNQEKKPRKSRLDYQSKNSFKPQRNHRATNSHWQILEIPVGSSREQVKKAYRAKMQQYHPDKVAHLGPELQKMALDKTRAVQLAYDFLAKK
ncbi:MAG: J domain-containing protein [Bdellovibrionota bacterium]